MSFLPPNQNSNQQGGSQQGGGLFGSTNTTGTSGSVFGAGPTQNPAPGGGLAGPANTSGTSSIFGGGNNPAPGSGGGIFGGGSTLGSNLFGGSSNTTTPANNAAPAQGGGFFGTGNTNSSNPDTTTPRQNPFGGGGNLFGGINNSSTTPASGGFLAPNQSSNLFGGAKQPERGTTATPPLFGKATTSTLNTGTTPASGGLFGSTTPKPPDNTSAPSTSTAPGGLFGGTATKPAENTQGSTPATGAFSGGLFGATTPKPAENATGSGSSFLGGGLFGKKPDAPAATPAATTTPSTSLPFSLGGNAAASTSAPSGGGLFGNVGSKDKADGKQDQPQAPSFNLFGAAKDASGEKKDAASTSTFGASANLFGGPKPSTDKKDATAASAGSGTTQDADKAKSTFGTTSTPISAPPPSMLRGKTIEEIVNKWSSDLESQIREFNKFATEVAVWDRALIENGNSLAALCDGMLTAEREQSDIDQSLEHIEQQQQDLLATLEMYEKTAEEILGGQGGSLRSLDTGPADTERDKNYMLATDLYSHLDDLSGSLTQMIEAVNELSVQDASSTRDDPMTQIAQILSSHLESLQWIDSSVRELENKVSDVEKRVKDAGVGVNGGIGNSTNQSKSRSYGLGRYV